MRKAELEKYLDQRTLNIARYIVNCHSSVREAGKEFGICYTVVSRSMGMRLKSLDSELYYKVRKVFEENIRYNRESLTWRKLNASNSSGRREDSR